MARMKRSAGIILSLMLALVGLALLAGAPAGAQGTGCSTPLPLNVGQFIYTRPGVFVRNLPTLSGGQVWYHQNSVTLRVVGGPLCADGYNWWQIEGPGNPGWIAEGAPDFRLIFPGHDPNATPVCATPLDLAAGSQAFLLASARVRDNPSRSGLVLTVLQAGEPVSIIGGGVCVEGIVWWQTRVPYGDSGALVDGWVAQGESDDLFLSTGAAPTATPELCAPPYRRLEIGIRAYVRYRDTQPKNVRTQPDRDAPVITSLLENVAVDIIGGPVCADGLNWWQIQVVGRPDVVGWMAEGGTGAGGYWLLPLGME